MTTLDLAWSEAEKIADDRGWKLISVKRGYAGSRWTANAVKSGVDQPERMHGTVPNKNATGRTPADALVALASALLEIERADEPNGRRLAGRTEDAPK